MNLVRGLAGKRRQLEEATATVGVPVPTVQPEVDWSDVRKPVTQDPMSTKLLNVVREMVESREELKRKLEEQEVTIADRVAKITALLHEKTFLENKVQTLSQDLSNSHETISDHKIQYDELAKEMSLFRQERDREVQELQESLRESGLNNRQLMQDLNRTRQESELRIQELEDRGREAQVQIRHLTEKFDMAMAENERLLGIINDFAAQASTIATRKLSAVE